MTGGHEGRSRVPVLLVVLGVLLGVVALTGALGDRSSSSGASRSQAEAPSPLETMITRAQDKLHRDPADAPTWALLGATYVEQARITGDPSFYPKAQGALDRSMQLSPTGNGEALIGLGTLANARHEFAAARRFGEQARDVRPGTAEVYGVLADAYTQLGDTDAATGAVQQMLNLEPNLAAFTRASYDLELHGRVDDARSALERAQANATSPDDIAFCRYYLGELAWNSGDLDQAATQYATGLAAAPQNASLIEGRAKVAAARGQIDAALADYAAITTRTPLPQYLLGYAELLESAGRTAEASAQYRVLRAQQKLNAAQGSTDNQVAALVAADHGDPAAALRLAQAEWDRRQSVFSADTLAWALHVNGRDAEALTYAERATSLGWRNASYTYHRGKILAGLGRNDEAVAALNEALSINPHFNPLHARDAVATRARLESA